MKTNSNFMLRTIAGEALLVPIGDASSYFNGMITLSEVAEFIWKRIDNYDEETIVQMILDEFEVSEEIARRDVYGFIRAMKEQGLIVD